MTIKIIHNLVSTIILSLTLNVLGVFPQLLGPPYGTLSEDGLLKFPELAKKYGHPAEEHHVITKDAYNLTLFHIPGNPDRGILMVHGNTPTGDCWLIRGNTSLAIVLAEQDYDLWVLNLRGSRYSRSNTKIDPDKNPSEFFNFTYYEQGVIDLPETIDHIQERNGQKKLLGIGHSSGTMLFYLMGAEKPEYNDKIKYVLSLAPIYYFQNQKGTGEIPPFLSEISLRIVGLTDTHELLNHDVVEPLTKRICLQPLGYEICIKLGLFMSMGYNPDGFEKEFLSTWVGHFPGGSSVKTFRYIDQIRERGTVAKYDYGKEKNLEYYGCEVPPEIDLSKVTMKVGLILGQQDLLAPKADVDLLNASLPNVVEYVTLPYKRFNHADFVWGRQMTTQLYPYILPLIKKYS